MSVSSGKGECHKAASINAATKGKEWAEEEQEWRKKLHFLFG
jgi:hypothetical protein